MNQGDPIDILARTMYGEARGEGTAGLQGVANVVMNRVAKPRWWGKDVIGVCLKPFQFSCWNKDDPNLNIIQNVERDNLIFNKAYEMATEAVQGALPDITDGATSYFAKGTPVPKWALGRRSCCEIGHHLFYKDA